MSGSWLRVDVHLAKTKNYANRQFFCFYDLENFTHRVAGLHGQNQVPRPPLNHPGYGARPYVADAFVFKVERRIVIEAFCDLRNTFKN